MKFSIVMPVYNVARYLTMAIEDVVNQSFGNLELILVDDCSTDLSGRICDEFVKKDCRIRVIHLNENGGLSNARNKGMEIAKGEYILFLDPDDRYDRKMLEYIKTRLDENSAKIVVFGLIEEYYNADEKVKYIKQIIPRQMYLNGKREVRKQIIDLECQTLFGYAWNKAYNLSYIKQLGVQFKKVTMIEDILFNIDVFKEINSCDFIAKPLYKYAIRKKGSLTKKYLPDYFPIHVRRIQSMVMLYKEWNMETVDVLQKLGSIYCRYFLSALQRNCSRSSMMNFRKRKEWVNEQFNSEMYKYLRDYMYPDNHILKLLAYAVRNGNISICLLLGRLIYVVKEKCPKLFSRLKQNR